ncbi:NUDIX domain-containing protein [Micromonospora sediminicola]|uniref:NUDIX domain-containing protein n=1 Tax=Micromonospora sediminicola TaxID=946078 RepID=UPI001FDF9FF9|nr:NUDIX hydrolase [Micromonospora sediminicola]
MAMSPYLARLRAVIGHELIQMPSVSVVVVDDDARILLVRHAGHHDGWAVPGGAVDVGEPPVEAAVRERSVRRSASCGGSPRTSCPAWSSAGSPRRC